MIKKSKASNRNSFFWIINALFWIVWILLAFNVKSRSDWALENSLVIVLGPLVFRFFQKGYLSIISYFFVFLFTTAHIVGAHYTYSLVPYDSWAESLFGKSLNAVVGWERNNYDRILHFVGGVLLFHPFRELFSKTTILKGRLLIVFTLLSLLAVSTIYELLEFGAAAIFGGELGIAYVGAQGDPWDAQKDQTLALFGSFIGLLISRVIFRSKNDFTTTV